MIAIKASALSNLSDARYFAAREVAWIGFCTDVSQTASYLPTNKIKEIADWLEGCTLVAEVGAESAESILELLKSLNMQAVQVGLFQDNAECAKLKAAGVEVLKELVIDASTNHADLIASCNADAAVVDVFIIDLVKNHITWDSFKTSPLLSSLQALSGTHKLLLQADIQGNQVNEVLSTLPNLAGLCLLGGSEERVGVKSFDELDDIFDALEAL